jgi:hypothetical protein
MKLSEILETKARVETKCADRLEDPYEKGFARGQAAAFRRCARDVEELERQGCEGVDHG